MKAFTSIVQQRGAVPFAAHICERVYMQEFRKGAPLPANLRRWAPTLDAMLDGVDTDGPLYLMIDQGVVRAGTSHRRPGVHIDGYWVPAKSAHGGSGGSHSNTPPPAPNGSHRGSGSHSYTPPVEVPGNHGGGGGRHSAGGSWADAAYEEHEGILLASSVQAARAYSGVFVGQPGDGGDCSHIDLAGLTPTAMLAGQCYAGNVTMLHESLPVAFDVLRTVVRINAPGWTPQ